MLLSPVQAAVSDQKEERAYNGSGDPMFAAWTESAAPAIAKQEEARCGVPNPRP